MSRTSNIQTDKVEEAREKVQKARARKHQAKPSIYLSVFLLLAAVAICISIIEIYQ